MKKILTFALCTAMLLMILPACQDEPDVIVTPSDNVLVKYVPYSDERGYFSMEIPEGWTVKTGLPPEYQIDLTSFAITVYDPNNVDRKIYLNLACSGLLKSEEAREWYNTYYPGTLGTYPAVKEVSTSGFFEAMGQLYGYKDFQVKENIGKTNLNGDLLNATAISDSSGKPISGMFTAMVSAMTNPVQKNMFNISEGTIDVGAVSAFTVVYETAPEGEFVDWQPILDHCLSSLTFTESFMSQRQEQWKQIMGTSSYIFNTANEISDMIMDSWEKRNTSQDVISQKQSDATLGYERVLDKETGEYYKAELGFGEAFESERYVVVDDDNAYLTPTSGWIEWKK